MNNYSFVTLVSSMSYVIPSVVLKESLKAANSKYPLLVMLLDSLDPEAQEILKRNNVNYKLISPLQYTDHIVNMHKDDNAYEISVLNTASKLRMFELKTFDKICYIDADSIVIQNIDDVFNFPDGSMLESGFNLGYGRISRGFSGFMVVSPKNHYEPYYYHLIKNFDCFDGDFFARLFFQSTDNSDYLIPKNYFLQSPGCDSNNIKNVKAIHYGNKPKPWNLSSEEKKYCSFAEQLYFNKIKTFKINY